MQPVTAAPRTERDVLRAALEVVRDRLPHGWRLDDAWQLGTAHAVPQVDALCRIAAPDGAWVTVVVEAKTVLEGGDVPAVREQLAALTAGQPDTYGLVVARYLSRSVQERLAAAGLGYVDATGNVLLHIAKPGLYIADRGADHDPWRGPGRPPGTLKGEPAAKVVRALVDVAGPWKVRDLVVESRTSTGSVYRVVEFLEREELATRDTQGRVMVPDWVPLLRRWSEDYGFVRSNKVTRWIAPRGLAALVESMRTGAWTDYAVSGTLAAATWAPYADARAAMVYVTDAAGVGPSWGLRPADAGVNVLLAEPAYDVVFSRLVSGEAGLKLAAPSQVAVDLLTGPGRAPSEAEELIAWMRRDESAWRR